MSRDTEFSISTFFSPPWHRSGHLNRTTLSPLLCLDNSQHHHCTFDFQTRSSRRARPEKKDTGDTLLRWRLNLAGGSVDPADHHVTSCWSSCLFLIGENVRQDSLHFFTSPAFTPKAMYISLPEKKGAFQELNLRAKGSHPGWPQSEG